ncbi:MAG: hypothetical protein H6637_05205 [Ardenticatenales bacterium]|nr:hypothetical protein [Ardenticatenales bacterium]
MKITKITARVGVTVNLGNYESMRLDLSAEAELAEGDDARSSTRLLFESLRRNVGREVAATVRDDQIIADLPESLRLLVESGK